MYQVRWFQSDIGVYHTMNCPTLREARSVVRDLKSCRYFKRIGIYVPTMRRVK